MTEFEEIVTDSHSECKVVDITDEDPNYDKTEFHDWMYGNVCISEFIVT